MCPKAALKTRVSVDVVDTKAVGAEGYVPWSPAPAQAGEGRAVCWILAIPNSNRACAGMGQMMHEAPDGPWEHFWKG